MYISSFSLISNLLWMLETQSIDVFLNKATVTYTSSSFVRLIHRAQAWAVSELIRLHSIAICLLNPVQHHRVETFR